MLTRRLVYLALAVTLLPATARAHATLLKSEPAPGAVLQTSPSEVRLRFNEEVLPGMSSLILILADGTERNLRGANDPYNVHILTSPLPHLPPGGYAIKWSVISADGHPLSGSYSFFVGQPPAASSTPVVIREKKEPFPILAPLL